MTNGQPVYYGNQHCTPRITRSEILTRSFCVQCSLVMDCMHFLIRSDYSYIRTLFSTLAVDFQTIVPFLSFFSPLSALILYSVYIYQKKVLYFIQSQ